VSLNGPSERLLKYLGHTCTVTPAGAGAGAGAGGDWVWTDYFESIKGPDGVLYDVSGMAEGPDLKRLLNGRSALIEHDEDERRLWASTRLAEYAEKRAITRRSDHVVDPVTGMTGSLWTLRSRQDQHDRLLLLSWSCEP
jgi:hypothetical protein